MTLRRGDKYIYFITITRWKLFIFIAKAEPALIADSRMETAIQSWLLLTRCRGMGTLIQVLVLLRFPAFGLDPRYDFWLKDAEFTSLSQHRTVYLSQLTSNIHVSNRFFSNIATSCSSLFEIFSKAQCKTYSRAIGQAGVVWCGFYTTLVPWTA